MLIACMLLFKNAFVGQNLIRNGSFESYNTPINWNLWGGDFIGYYTWPPDTVMIDWGEYQTVDYCVAACPHVYSGVPINHFGSNHSKDGNAYVGLVVYAKGAYEKEYLYQHLTQPLQSGKLYCLSFYVNRADRFTYAIRNIGALFVNNLPSLSNGFEINAVPQVENQTSIISDTANWTQIQGCFTANGDEQYLVIGNFTTNYNTDTLNTNSTNLVPGRESASYYYVDDITLIDQTTVGVNELEKGNSISIYPNPTKDKLNIDLGTVKENTDIKVYNALGELVLTEDLTTQNSSLKTHHLPSGIYFYRILVGEKIIKNDKIIIIK